MDRRPTYQPPTSRYPTFNKIHYLERKPNEDLVQKLFLLIEEGNLFRIRDYLLSNNLTTLVRANTGETLLHIVIKSSNLTNENKLELVKYLIDHNSPVGLADDNNVTPLHLACKLQLKNIVELLINAGANVNAIDNQGMTPLHYQILNESEQCKTEKNTKVGSVVPERINKEQVNEDLIKIGDEILPIIYNDPNINRYIRHIRNTIRNLHNMYPGELYTRQNSYILEVSDKIIDPKINDNEKYNTVLISMSDYSNSLDEFVTSNLKKTLNKLDIHPNYPNGWGPDNYNQMNNILPYKNIGAIFDEMENDKDRSINDVFIKLRKQIANVSDEINVLYQFFYITAGLLVWIKNEPTNRIPRAPNLENIYAGNITIGSGGEIPIPDFNIHHKTDLLDLRTTGDVLINDVTGIPINNNYYFISNSKYIIDIINGNMVRIRTNLEDLNRFIESDIIYGTYDILYSNIIVLVQNIILHLTILANESSFIRERISLLSRENDRGNVPPLREYINGYISTVRSHIERMEKSLSVIYTTLTQFISQMNSVVSIINRISAIRFIKQYHNENIDTDLLKIQTNQLQNFFDRTLQPLPLLPTTLSDYQNEINLTIRQQNVQPIEKIKQIDKIKRRAWELYVPQYTFINFASFYTNNSGNPISGETITSLNDTPITNIDALSSPIIGFAVSLPDIPSFAPLPMPELRYDNRTKFYQNDINNLQGATANRIGKIGVIAEKRVDKTDAAQPSVAILLDEHLFIIKYIILQYLVSNIKKYISGAIDVPQHYQRFVGLINDFINKQKNVLSLDDINESIIYALIARIADASIINFIKTCTRETTLENIYNVFKQIKNIGNSYSDIARDIKLTRETILLNYEANYKLNLNEIIDNIITKFYNPYYDYKSVQLNYTALLLKEKEQVDPDQHIIYNYSFSTKVYENKCYKVKNDITTLLIDNNARINQRDLSGNTPIYYSIELQDLSAVNTLIANNASVNNSLSRNLIGLTPMLHALKLYRVHLDILQDIDKLSNDLFNKITLYIRKKPEYKNNILKYSNNIFKEVLLIINHHFYLQMKQYKRNWTYEKHKIFLDNFKSMIDMNSPVNKFIPLLQYDRTLILDKGVRGVDVLTAKINYVNIKISQVTELKSELEQQIRNLKEEKNDIQGKLADQYYRERNKEIDDLIINLTNDLISMNNSLRDSNDLLQKLVTSSSRLSTKNTRTLNYRVDTFVSRNINDPVSLYDKIFTDVVNYQVPVFKYTSNKDLLTYLILWDDYINDPSREYNITQLHLLIIKYQYNIITDFINKKGQIDVNVLQNILENLKDLHKNIIGAFAIDYDQLPNEYNKNTNYALAIVLDIITHVVRHNLCSVLYTTIVKLLAKYVESINNPNVELFTREQYSTYLTGVIENIINVGTGDESLLLKYIVGILPKKLTKFILNIYESEYDPDRSITSFDMLFDSIVNILTLAKTISITKNSLIVEQLKSYIFPYYRDIFEIFIKEIKNMTDSYMRYIISESKQIDILTSILNKAVQEKDVNY